MNANQMTDDMDGGHMRLIEIEDYAVDVAEYHPSYSVVQDQSQRSSSGVWKYFGSLQGSNFLDKKHVCCIRCFNNRKIKKYQRSTSTGNLIKHLKKYHNIKLGQTFRIKKLSDNSIISIRKEGSLNDSGDHDDGSFSIDDPPHHSSTVGIGQYEYVSNDITELLISEVAKRPALYNPLACQEQGLKHKTRQKLWLEIYEALEHYMPLERLPKIWKNIRDRYHKVKREMKAHGQTKPKYRYFDMLSFLDRVDAECDQQHHSDLMDEKAEEIESYVDDYLLTDEDHEDYISSDVTGTPEKCDNESMAATKVKQAKIEPPHSENEYSPSEQDSSRYNSLHKSDNVLIQSFTDIEIAGNTMLLNEHHAEEVPPGALLQQHQDPSESFANRKSDEFDKFGDFVAEVMRNMSKAQSRRFQIKVLGLISDCEVSHE